jgi:hypothetical protein
MKALKFDETSNLIDCLESIKNEEEAEIKIFTSGIEFLRKSLNREIIKLVAKTHNKVVSFDDTLKTPATQKEPLQEKTLVPAENLGFVEGKDIAEQAKGPPVPPQTPITAEPKKGFKLPPFKFPKGKWLYIAIGAFLAVFLIGGLLIYFLPSADVVLTTEPNYKENEQTLTASKSATKVDISNGVIPLKILNISEEDNLTADSTGTKTTGTPAKGRVKIVNHDIDNDKSFFAGTTITTHDNAALTFTLDDDVTVPKAIAGCEADCPSTGVDVTASTIGEAGNLAAGTVFSVGGASIQNVFAKNDTNFSGGSSKKITVVSSDDQSKAKDTLLKNLEKKATSDLQNKNQGIIIPDGGLTPTIINETYSKAVGEEAQNFQLSLKVNFAASTFSEDDLKTVLTSSMISSIPNGYEINKKDSKVTSEILEKNGDDLKISAKIKASLTPSLDQNEIKNRISGKSFASVDSYLRSLDSVSGFDIKISPSAFRFFGVLPLSKNKIKIEITKGT